MCLFFDSLVKVRFISDQQFPVNMFFAKSFLLSLLCLITVDTLSQLGDKCVIKSGFEGRCQDSRKCNSIWKDFEITSAYCGSFDIVCCPPPQIDGDKCVDSTTLVKGRCENLSECNYALKYRKKLSDCYDSTVCCPPVQLRISEKMCFHYIHHMNYDYNEKHIGLDGVQTDNVRVGVGTKDLRKPSHLAIIGFTQNKEIEWRCGGSIISPFFILSSAHCAKNVDFGLAKWVRIRDLGLLRRFSSIKDAKHQDFLISKAFIHPDYISSSIYGDIGLFKLEKEIIFGDDYQPACLHTARNVPEVMERYGFGVYTRSFEALKVIDEYEICEIIYRDFLSNGVRDELQICARTNSSRSTFCPGDRGGLLQHKADRLGNVRGHYVVAGILSLTKGCSDIDKIEVYTRISAYLDWIEEIVWEDEIEPETVTFVFRN